MAQQILYEGLRELAQALKETDRTLLVALEAGLEKTGDLVRDDAEKRFEEYRKRAHGDGRARSQAEKATFVSTAEFFQTRVRARGRAAALVVVAQGEKRSPRLQARRQSWTDLQLEQGLEPAADAREAEAEALLISEVDAVLAAAGL